LNYGTLITNTLQQKPPSRPPEFYPEFYFDPSEFAHVRKMLHSYSRGVKPSPIRFFIHRNFPKRLDE